MRRRLAAVAVLPLTTLQQMLSPTRSYATGRPHHNSAIISTKKTGLLKSAPFISFASMEYREKTFIIIARATKIGVR